MGFFDDLKDKVVSTSQTATQKAKDLAEVTKLNSQISDSKKTVNNLYVELGKKYFEQIKENPGEDFADVVNQINEETAKQAELAEQVRQIKGIGICPACGAEIPAGQKFCSECGAKVEDAAPEEIG